MQSITTNTVTVQSISKGQTAPSSHPNDVRFLVEYPEDYKGKKHMPEGVVVISKESAEQFTKAGIGHIIEENKDVQSVSELSKESAEQFTKAGDSDVEAKEDIQKTKSTSKTKNR